MIHRGKHNILGVQVDAADYEASATAVTDAAEKAKPLTVSALAVHGVMTGVLDAAHRHRLNQTDWVLPDGQPVRWALKWLHGVDLPDRVYGPNLMLEVCRRAAERKLPIFLFGATDAVLANLSRNLQAQFPGLQIAGTQCSRFRRVTPEEKMAIVQTIRDSGAALTFVGLGCPRQEIWAYEYREHLAMPLLAVGAAFDFHAGRMPQAPEYMQRRGLEWLYRLCREPRRLWRRYVMLNPLYLILLFLQRMGWRRFDPHNTHPPQEECRFG